MKLRRYLRLFAIFAAASISAQLEYRTNFIVSLLGALLASGGALFGLFIVSSNGQVIGGWSYSEASVVVGVFTLIQGFIGAFLYPNLNKIAEAIRLGTMDFTLLKPIDAQFLVSARNINLFRLIDMLIGTLVIIWAMSGLASVTPVGIVLGIVLLALALVIVYAIWFGQQMRSPTVRAALRLQWIWMLPPKP